MKKFLSIITGILLVGCLIIGSTLSVFADDNLPESSDVQSVVASMYYQELPTIPGQVEPRKTITGSGGVARLDYVKLGTQITWSIKPSTILPYTFAGTLKIYNTKKTKCYRTFNLYEAGVGTEGNDVFIGGLGLRKGSNYVAKLEGSAITVPVGVYWVSDDAELTFNY